MTPSKAGKNAMIHHQKWFENGFINHPREPRVGLNSDGTSNFGVGMSIQ